MAKLTIQSGKKKEDTLVIETDRESIARLLAILAAQLYLKDPCKCVKVLSDEIRRTFKMDFVVKEFLLLSLNDINSIMKQVPLVAPDLGEAISLELKEYANRSAEQIILDVGPMGALALTKQNLGPEDLPNKARQAVALRQKQEREEAIRKVARRERSAILLYLGDTIRFCELVLGSARVRTEPIRNEARTLLKDLEKARQQFGSQTDEEVAQEGLSLKVHQTFRSRLVELRDLIREELLSNNRPPPNPSTVMGALQKNTDTILSSFLRLARSRELVAYEDQVARLRFMVWKALLPIVPSLELLGRAGLCRLCYRGSLTDAVRNSKKSQETSQGKVAQLLDIDSFDVDAFIEVPDEMWEDWCNNKFIPVQNQHRKCSLTDIRNHLSFFKHKKPEPGQEARFAEALLLMERLEGIILAMEEARKALASVPGYKRTLAGEIDFSIVVQPENKTLKEQRHGKKFDQGSLARSLLQLPEIFRRHELPDLDITTTLAVVLPELHVEIELDSPPGGFALM